MRMQFGFFKVEEKWKSFYKYSPIKILYAFFLLMMLSSCDNDSAKKSAPDVSHLDLKVDLVRYDRLLSELDAEDPQSSYLRLVTKHPRITDLYFKQLTGLFKQNQDTFYNDLGAFITEPRITSLMDTIADAYPYEMDLKKRFVMPLKYLKHYFPEYGQPVFYTLFTEFGYPTFIFENQEKRNGIGIGLDFFLGNDFEYKKIDPGNAVFSNYMTRSYTEEHIVKKSMEMVAVDIIGNPPGKRFIDQMILQGKKAYLLEKLMPETPDTILWEYTPEQMQWVKDNEQEIWSFFLEHKLTYETSHLKIANYLEPAPTSKGMPEASPGRTGCYIGYKIVSSYMRKNKDVSLSDLIGMRDSEKILQDSKYKPARK